MTGSKFSREAYLKDMQAKLAEATKAQADKEVELRQVGGWWCGMCVVWSCCQW